MKREFLQNFKVNDQPLTKDVIDAIMAENGRDIEAAKDADLSQDDMIQELLPWSAPNECRAGRKEKNA